MVQVHAQLHSELESFQESFSIHIPDYTSDFPVRQTRKTAVSIEPGTASLTVRETEILVLFGKGLSAKGVARSFDISPGTVKWHVRNVYEKLGASSREDALSKARLRQMIPL